MRILRPVPAPPASEALWLRAQFEFAETSGCCGSARSLGTPAADSAQTAAYCQRAPRQPLTLTREGREGVVMLRPSSRSPLASRPSRAQPGSRRSRRRRQGRGPRMLRAPWRRLHSRLLGFPAATVCAAPAGEQTGAGPWSCSARSRRGGRGSGRARALPSSRAGERLRPPGASRGTQSSSGGGAGDECVRACVCVNVCVRARARV